MALRHARQAVLIGDPKQLGPVFACRVLESGDSMLSRLINARYQGSSMLTEQFRMHPRLMHIPNELVYNNQITSLYRQALSPTFMCKHTPIIFVNCKEEEGDFGTSYFNRDESLIIKKLLKYFS